MSMQYFVYTYINIFHWIAWGYHMGFLYIYKRHNNTYRNHIFLNVTIIKRNLQFKPLLGIEDVIYHSSTLRYM